MADPKFAPREVFEQMLEWGVMPTFDLLIEYGDKGFVWVYRSIEPYKNVWALPGLRMYKGEEISDTLVRIAHQELGIKIDAKKAVIIGQCVGKFKTEFERQDLSTGYYIHIEESVELQPNPEHFSNMKISYEISSRTGAMYRYYAEMTKDKSKG